MLGGQEGEAEGERGEALQITLLKPLWFHTGGKVVLILEENGGTEILQ